MDKELLSSLAEKYKFTGHIPDEIQEYFIKYRSSMAKSVLKAVKDFSYIYNMIVTVYFGARKIGFRPSLIASKVIAGSLILIVSGSLTAAVIISSKYILSGGTEDKIAQIIVTEEKKSSVDAPEKNIIKQDKNQAVKPDALKIGILKFSANNVKKNIASDASYIINDELKKILGPGNAGFIGKNAKGMNVASGSVGKMGKKYLISVKLIDNKLNIIFTSAKSIGSIEEMDSACREIAKEMAEAVK